MNAVLADPLASRVVLVGVSEYEHLNDLPAVGNNLTTLRDVLTDPGRWGLPPEHCAVIAQPPTAEVAFAALDDATSAATDTLLLYYSGHGLIDTGNDDELYLALPGSTLERAHRSAIPYSMIRREILGATRVRRKIVILDCCYSGRALGRWMSGQDAAVDVTDILEINGACVLTATARTRRALAEPGEEFTAFSGEIINIWRDGLPEGPEFLDMDLLFQHADRRLRAKHRPRPQRGQLGSVGSVAVARNTAHPGYLRAEVARLRAQLAEVRPGNGVNGPAAAVRDAGDIRAEAARDAVETRAGAVREAGAIREAAEREAAEIRDRATREAAEIRDRATQEAAEARNNSIHALQVELAQRRTVAEREERRRHDEAEQRIRELVAEAGRRQREADETAARAATSAAGGPAVGGPPGGSAGGGPAGGGPAGGRAAPPSYPIPRTRPGADALLRLDMDLVETAFGVEAPLTVDTATRCDTCNATGAAPGTSPVTCGRCRGKGTAVSSPSRPSRECTACRGHGTVIPSPCPTCAGDGRVRTRRSLTVKIPAGVEDGMRVRLAGQGEVGPGGGPPGDLYVEVIERPHEVFSRKDDDLHCRVAVPMTAAAVGTRLTIGTLDGEESIQIKPGTQPGDKIRIRGKGVPHLRGAGRGDLWVHMDVRTPTKLDPEQERSLRAMARDRDEDQPGLVKDEGFFSRLRDAFNGK